MNVIYGAKINSRWRIMPITEYLERNARDFGNDVALVELNPQEKETKKNYLERI